MSLINRYRVVMHGNQPVIEDAETIKSVKWFPDVLHDQTSRKRAEKEAAELNHTGRATTVNEIIDPHFLAKCPHYQTARYRDKNGFCDYAKLIQFEASTRRFFIRTMDGEYLWTHLRNLTDFCL